MADSTTWARAIGDTTPLAATLKLDGSAVDLSTARSVTYTVYTPSGSQVGSGTAVFVNPPGMDGNVTAACSGYTGSAGTYLVRFVVTDRYGNVLSYPDANSNVLTVYGHTT